MEKAEGTGLHLLTGNGAVEEMLEDANGDRKIYQR